MKARAVDVAVIGAGTAGLAAFRAARAHTNDVVLIEGGPYGTTCARVGCMPSKLLIAAAEAAHTAEQAAQFGVNVGGITVDRRAVMNRVRRERDRFVGFVVDGVEAIDESQRLRGYAEFLDDQRLRVTTADGRASIIRAKRIVIATGSTATLPPPFAALGDRAIINDDVFDWTELPKSVAVFGPGVIGIEIGQALHRLGVEVHLFGLRGQLGPITDPAVLEAARGLFSSEFHVDLDADVRGMKRTDHGVQIDYVNDDNRQVLEVDYVLAATGRRPNIGGLKLENTMLSLDERGVPRFDPQTMQAGDSTIFIAGDVSDDRALLHEAADEGKIAGNNAGRYPQIEGGTRRSALGIVFSDPQIAMVGDTFASLMGRDIVIGEVSFEDQGRSRVMLKNQGLLRLYADAVNGRFLGAEMVGPRAEHIGHLLAWAHQAGMQIERMLEMPFYHPTIEEGLRTALRDAAAKRQQQVPQAA